MMTDAIRTSAAARNAIRWAGATAMLAMWLCTAGGAQAITVVIDDFESGAPVSLFESGGQNIHLDNRAVQTGLPVFSGVRETSVLGGYATTSSGRAELVSTLGDDGIRFTGTGGELFGASGAVWYRSQTDSFHGMDFDALAVADRFYVKLSEDPGAGVRLVCMLQDQDAAYSIGGTYLDGGGYLEIPFAAWRQDEFFHPDFHHVSAFAFSVAFQDTTSKSVTVTEFGITGVAEPASAMLLAAGGLAVLLWRCARAWRRIGM
jgi:hypothetical protein